MAKAFSYIRFSTPGQSLGDSLRRQVDKTAAYCATHGLVLDESLRDEGRSGYHGRHLKGGSLGRFIDRVKAGDIPTGSVLIVEAFDRLSRQSPRLAQEQFLSLINAGIEIVTLMDGQRFSAKSLDSNIGQLFMSIGMMLGANQESANKADRIRETWKARRTSQVTNLAPAWIRKGVNGFEIDPAKASIVRRMYAEIQTIGIDKLTAALNQEGVPVLWDTKVDGTAIKREQAVWHQSGVRNILRTRRVLGEQPIGKYVDGKRTETSECTKGAYPAIISEAVWFAAQQAMDSRKRGSGHALAGGRNGQNITNLFGKLAVCASCKGRMIVVQRGRLGTFHYMGCSLAKTGSCSAKGYFRLDKIEAQFASTFATIMHTPETPDDDTAPLRAMISEAQAQAERLEKLYREAYRRSLSEAPGSLADLARADIETEHKAKLAEVRRLESRLAGAVSAKPSETVLSDVKTIWASLEALTGDDRLAARAKLANGLPTFVKQITFKPDGSYSTEWTPYILNVLDTVKAALAEKVNEAQQKKRLPKAA